MRNFALRTWLSAFLICIAGFIFFALFACASSASDPSAQRPGGATTAAVQRQALRSFIQTPAGLGIEHASGFREGQAVFGKRWNAEEGLGPLYNGRSCAICHPRGGRGHPPIAGRAAKYNASTVIRLVAPHDQSLDAGNYGRQIQPRAIGPISGEGTVIVAYAETAVHLTSSEIVLLRQPRFEIAKPAYGALPRQLTLSARIAPQLVGVGLLEAVPEALIRSLADPEDRDHDGISGRIREVPALGGGARLGRFGWKADASSLHEQIASAFSLDMGLSTRLLSHPAGDCTQRQTACLDLAAQAQGQGVLDPEVADIRIERLIGFLRDLAVPLREATAGAAEARGEALFGQLGCASCHRPRLTTGYVDGKPHLSGQTIWPYTDLLLHDMGPGLADRTSLPLAEASEWRTPPLWGIGLTKQVAGEAHYLHDGRARSLVEAILWHGGEASSARLRFVKLSKLDRDLLIRFVGSL